jgi:DNA-directed RNA polymerase subunit L
MRLSQYSNIKFTHERASHPSQEIAINTKLQIKKRQEIAAEKQADKDAEKISKMGDLATQFTNLKISCLKLVQE